MNTIAQALVFISSCCNPFIYCISSSNFSMSAYVFTYLFYKYLPSEIDLLPWGQLRSLNFILKSVFLFIIYGTNFDKIGSVFWDLSWNEFLELRFLKHFCYVWYWLYLSRVIDIIYSYCLYSSQSPITGELTQLTRDAASCLHHYLLV